VKKRHFFYRLKTVFLLILNVLVLSMSLNVLLLKKF